MGGFCLGDFVLGGFCPGDFVPGALSGGLCPGGFVRGDFVLEPCIGPRQIQIYYLIVLDFRFTVSCGLSFHSLGCLDCKRSSFYY